MHWPQAFCSGCYGESGIYQSSIILEPLLLTRLLASLLSGVHRGHDNGPSAHRLDVRQHQKCGVGAQFMHVISTGTLIMFSPPSVTAAQETAWYAVYACALWITVAIIALVYGRSLAQEQAIRG
jgi:hypothetical protein